MNIAFQGKSLFSLLGVVALLGVPAPSHAGPQPDFNGDGRADLAIGVPGESIGRFVHAGAVSVIYGAGGELASTDNELWSQEDFGTTSATGDLFGASLAWGDFNNDGKTDLAVGAPGRSGSGGVYVLSGSPTGLIPEPSQSVFSKFRGDWYGGALAVGDFDGDSYADLAIGVPFHDGSSTNEGQVNVFRGSRWGLQILVIGGEPSVRWNSNDHYGAALAAGDFNGDAVDDLAVGIPERDSSDLIDTGAVEILYGQLGKGLIKTAQPLLFQENGGVHLNEAGDHFGRSVAAGDFNGDGCDDLAVGVPGEDVGSLANIGAVQVIYCSGSTLSAVDNLFVHQNTDGVVDIAEAGDAFGVSLVAADFNGDGEDDLAIGVSGEDIEAVAAQDAGAMQVLYGDSTGLSTEDNQLWSQQSSGIRGGSEPGDAFGAGRYGHIP